MYEITINGFNVGYVRGIKEAKKLAMAEAPRYDNGFGMVDAYLRKGNVVYHSTDYGKWFKITCVNESCAIAMVSM